MDDAVESLSDSELGVVALLQQAADALARGDHSNATQVGIEALIATVKVYSPNSEPTVVCLCTLGAALSAERPHLAECMLNAAVAILAGYNLPPDDLSVALQSNLSTVYRATGRPNLAVTAASFCARILDRDSKTPPRNSPLRSTILVPRNWLLATTTPQNGRCERRWTCGHSYACQIELQPHPFLFPR